MSELYNFLTIPFLLAMFLALNMGASGTSPSFSAAYGANVIKRSMIPGLFGIMVLAGALLAGKEVTLTLGSGLIDQTFFTPVNTSIVLLAIGLSLLISNLLGVPQSTSQSTVLSIAGAATAVGGLNTHKLFYEIIPAWFILPVISFLLMLTLTKWIFPLIKSKVYSYDYSHMKSHAGFKLILILASCYVAFSIGANNVANAAAPISSLTINALGSESIQNFLPITILSVLIIAPCFGIGSSLLGHKVTESQGRNMVHVTPFNATVIAIIVASLLLIASVSKGIPTSLVQLNGAAFIALSISSNGWSPTFSNKTVKRFFLVWAIAPVFAFILTYILIKMVS
ncbi:inorganic phosphate transporter [Fulvivirga sedimenti]|uniref:Inorganic phosphate transporter n=1 Tax=Fulvivirga sedimenti TaxID=2879465 RepID=A0A9X1HVL3_9BACT|nr:inorganic phosphate transporter [Fulvivirga sedimenti]MCA6074757.1 inorganic phosphate transporter [Fulvivirga sedimenti]MCA6075934.1 inorganic phosphate transporter [Fulvivirga sedimenti]MCA6077062.1 inorganic phosphate transporter [Fulvivirga sedimenti]